MAITAPDSIYRKERSYYLDLLESQIVQLRTDPGRRLHVVEQLRELSQLTPGSIEASLVVGDTLFHQICCDLEPLFLAGVVSLLGDTDPVTEYQVADILEAAVPAEVQDPFNHPATW
ncbi:hypothetical protein N7537_011881 [Penicillium hordei]|uniref:Uncharacterized protein n=1 Tax=Penicillium hordei TaxID=40994 RepID=A0AAD6DML0_9EURO|nr:uncharacterized protein N7537_011881 [Penicillium hordei]KAJ5589203.1 hypothetical protein N7537_011881 [Penicillium hordei]